jgi:hypothetical protein
MYVYSIYSRSHSQWLSVAKCDGSSTDEAATLSWFKPPIVFVFIHEDALPIPANSILETNNICCMWDLMASIELFPSVI